MIVIPAAGKGSRFKEAGYTEPKHLIPLLGVPMVERVAANVLPLDRSGFVNVVTELDVGETSGAIETLLRANLPDSGRLVVANCDQLIKLPSDPLPAADGWIFTFRSANPAHSYVLTDEDDRITEIREKEVISNRAVAGVYVFNNAGDFRDACSTVMQYADDSELYVSEALALMIAWGIDLRAIDVPTAILGTPEDFQRFEVALECAS